jgi:hypothetical protein
MTFPKIISDSAVHLARTSDHAALIIVAAQEIRLRRIDQRTRPIRVMDFVLSLVQPEDQVHVSDLHFASFRNIIECDY